MPSLKFEDVRDWFFKNDCELLSLEYVNVHTIVKYRCSCLHIRNDTLQIIKRHDLFICKKCKNVQKIEMRSNQKML